MRHETMARKFPFLTWVVCLVTLTPCAAFAVTPVHLDRKGERWAASTLRKMSLEEKIGQMIMPWARIEFMNLNSPEYLSLQEKMRKYHVGGFGVTVFFFLSGFLITTLLRFEQWTTGTVSVRNFYLRRA